MNYIKTTFLCAICTFTASAFPSAGHPELKAGKAESVITTAPGTEVLYSRSSTAIALVGDLPSETGDFGFAGFISFDDANGDVYLKNPFSQLLTNGYIKGKKSGDKISVELPQLAVNYLGADGVTYPLYAVMLKLSDDGEDMVKVDNQTLTFSNVDGAWVMDGDKDLIFGLTFDDFYWTGFGEKNIKYEPMKDAVATVPATAEFEDWVITYSGQGHTAKMAIDGDKCYLCNLLNNENGPKGALVGTVTENGIEFDTPQYIGVDESVNYLTYVYGGNIDRTFIEEYNTYLTQFIPDTKFVLKKQANGTYAAENSLMLTPFTDIKSEYFWSQAVYDKPVLREYKPGEIDYTPADPSIVDYQYYSSYGFGYVSFEIPALNVNGELLDTKNMYYNIYFDNEIFTLEPDEYPNLKEAIMDIPYDFSDDPGNYGDIKLEGTKHTLIIYMEGIEELGICSFYVDPVSKETYYSEIITADAAGVENVAVDNVKAPVEYYNLNGIRVDHPSAGLYIVRQGNKTSKIMIR